MNYCGFRLSLFAALVLAAALILPACSSLNTTSATTFAQFAKTDLIEGTGAEATPNSSVTVSYKGWLYDLTKPESKGPMFADASGSTFIVSLGAAQVIAGWDQGIPGMKEGGVRRLIIPPSLAYGGTRNGPIPPNATLVFEITLVSVNTGS